MNFHDTFGRVPYSCCTRLAICKKLTTFLRRRNLLFAFIIFFSLFVKFRALQQTMHEFGERIRRVKTV